MLITDLAKQVHENAVAHGWWEDKREAPEIIALIHSEWSEALEEARAGRPMAYVIVDEVRGGFNQYTERVLYNRGKGDKYDYEIKHGAKPEGIAVELIDGCIRILDYMGELEADVQDSDSNTPTDIESLYTDDRENWKDHPAAHIIAYLHMMTSEALCDANNNPLYGDLNPMKLMAAMTLALCWVKDQGLDPLALLLEKHEYNKTRPYKHGKRF